MLLVGVILSIKCGIVPVQFFFKHDFVLFRIAQCILLMNRKNKFALFIIEALISIMGSSLFFLFIRLYYYNYDSLDHVKVTVVVVYSILTMVVGMLLV
jgi:hypothetical protein